MLYLVPPLVAEAATTAITTAQLASIAIGTVLPILVAIVTAKVTSPGVKAVLLVLFSSISGFLTEYLSSATFVWQQAALGALLTFVTGVAAHMGFWSKVNAGGSEPISRKVQGVRALTLFDRNSEAGSVDWMYSLLVLGLLSVLALSLANLWAAAVLGGLSAATLWARAWFQARYGSRHRSLTA